ncbi:transglycosylase SLT domain-containing protein [Streptomyces sp. NPDC015131]|uniref:transglycosylase SLT domain-containing protein n=1 Tax=Streptomyces sp. NPDC015131 TaxID=3364941 RepID=UPI0036FDD495
MAVITNMGISIFSRFNGSGVREAQRQIAMLRSQVAAMDARMQAAAQNMGNSFRNARGPVDQLSTAMRSFDRSVSLVARGFTGLAGALRVAVLPGLIPIGAAATAAAGGLTSMGVAAGSALGIFGMAMAGAIQRTMGFNSSIGHLYKELVQAKTVLSQMTPGTKQYEQQLAKVNKLQDQFNNALRAAPPAQRAFLTAMVQLNDSYQRFITLTQSTTLPIATKAVEGLAAGFAKLPPVVRAVAPAINEIAEGFKKWMSGQGFDRFIQYVLTYGVPALNSLLNAGRSVLTFLGIGFRAFAPLGLEIAQVLEKGAAALAKWAQEGGFQRFLAYVREHAPQVREFFSALGQLLANIWAAAVKLAPSALALATALARMAASLPPGVLMALVAGFVALKGAWSGLLIPLGLLRLGLGGGGGLFGVIGRLLPLILRLGGIIGAAVSLIILAWQHSEFFRNKVAELGQALKLLWEQHLQPLIQKFGELNAKLQPLWSLIGQIAGVILGVFVQALIIGVQLVAGFADALGWVVDKVVWLANNLGPIWTTVWNGIKLVADTVWGALQIAWNAVVNAFVTAWNTVSPLLSTAWNTVWGLIQNVAQTIWSGMQLAWTTFVGVLQTIWSTVSVALSTSWSAVWNVIRTTAEAVWNALRIAWNAFIMALQTIWSTVSAALSTAWNAVWTGIRTVAEAVWSALRAGWQAFVSVLQTMWSAVSGALQAAWSTVWNGIRTVAEAVWNALRAAWNAFLTTVRSIWDAISAALSGNWSAVWNAIRTAGEAIWNAIRAAWQAFLTAVQTIWTTASAVLRTAWDAFWNAVRTAAQAIWTAMQTAWNAFLTAVRTIWTTVSTALQAAWTAFWNAVRTAAQAIWTAMQAAWSAFLTAVRTIWNTISSALATVWTNFWNAISTAARNIWRALQDAWDNFLGTIRRLWDTFSGAIRTAWQNTWTTLQNIARTVWNAIGGIIERAINGVISIINGLIRGFNKITNFLEINVSVGEIGNVNFPSFATGGVVEWQHFAKGGLPGGVKPMKRPCPEIGFAHGGPVNLRRGGALRGYAPGKDTVPAILSRGEGVLTPEAVRGLGGPGFVNSANRQFAGHRGAGRGAASFDQFGWQRFAVGGMTAAALARAGVPLSMVTQGEFSHGSLSAGTHAGGGAVDLATTSPAVLARLHAAGFAAWIRGPEHGMSPHIHAVLMNHPQLSGPARAQVASFRSGGSGLGVGGGGGGGGIDIMGMIAPHVGKILLNVYRGLDALSGIGGAVASFFSGGSGGGGDTGPAAGRTNDGGVVGPGGVITGGDSSTNPDLEAPRSKGPLNAALSTLGFASNFVGPGLAKSTAQAAARVATGAAGREVVGGAAGAMLKMLAQFVLPALTKEHIATGLSDAKKSISDFGGGGGFSKIAAGFGQKLIGDVLPDFLMKKAAAATPPVIAMGGGGGGNVQQWAGLAAQALARAGLAASQLPRFLALMQAESGGNPMAINTWDSNAAKGQASRGLMQVIPSTFAAHRDPFLPNNILDPLANMTAAARYIKSRYGGSVPGSPYANGTPGALPGPHLVGERGPELVNFRGGETVEPAKKTAAIISSMTAAPTLPAMPPLPGDLGGLKEEGFLGVTQAAQQMAEVVQSVWEHVVQLGQAGQESIKAQAGLVAQSTGLDIPAAYVTMRDTANSAWLDMNLQSALQWGLMRDTTFAEAELHQGTTMPLMTTAMQTKSNAAWLDMNLQSALQWALMRDTTFTEAELHQGTTMPLMATTMQTASDTAWTTMQTTSTEQWTTIRDGNVMPFEEHMQTTMPTAAQAMNEAVSAAFTSMVATIVEQLDAAIAKIEEFIAATEAAIAAAEALAAAQAAAAASGGGGGALGAANGSAAAALAAAGVSSGMIVQGPYSTSVGASAGTHAGGGVYDIASTDPGLLAKLHANGFAAWIRSGPGWQGNEHIHAVYSGASDLSPQARWQLEDFKRGGSGLGIPGNLYTGTPGAHRGWSWVGEHGPELMWFRGGERVMPNHDVRRRMSGVDSMLGMLRNAGGLEAFVSKVCRRAVETGALERQPTVLVGRGGVKVAARAGDGDITINVTFNGPTDTAAVKKFQDEVIPELRGMLQQRVGTR